MVSVSVFGLGFVGGSMKKSFGIKGVNVKGYDKYKESDALEECVTTDIAFLCLPTLFDEETNEYDKSCILEVCDQLTRANYRGITLLKSTVEPGTTEWLAKMYPTLLFVHNPEFLTTVTAFEDFHNQRHIVLGKASNVSDSVYELLQDFYRPLYPGAEFSCCTCSESESMKIFGNCFYSVKVQFFNELYLMCEKSNIDYERVRAMMIKNGWINPMHTTVPGPDGQLSYGGLCFPKDTNALLNHMKRDGVPHKVLEASIEERNIMREPKIEDSPSANFLQMIARLFGSKKRT
jgi:UDPglucose 6-dehydrogenase